MRTIKILMTFVAFALVFAACDKHFTNELDGGDLLGSKKGTSNGIVWNDSDRDNVVETVVGVRNTRRTNASGTKITSNAHSDRFPGIFFIWDWKQTHGLGYLKVKAWVFDQYEYFMITTKESNLYWDFKIVNPNDPTKLTEDDCYVFHIDRNWKNVNMVFVPEFKEKVDFCEAFMMSTEFKDIQSYFYTMYTDFGGVFGEGDDPNVDGLISYVYILNLIRDYVAIYHPDHAECVFGAPQRSPDCEMYAAILDRLGNTNNRRANWLRDYVEAQQIMLECGDDTHICNFYGLAKWLCTRYGPDGYMARIVHEGAWIGDIFLPYRADVIEELTALLKELEDFYHEVLEKYGCICDLNTWVHVHPEGLQDHNKLQELMRAVAAFWSNPGPNGHYY